MIQDRGRRTPGETLALAAILILAAALRFGGLTHHLHRVGPAFDERDNFVDPIRHMWRAGTADPAVYGGYPGFFNYLAFLPVNLGHAVAGEVGAYAAGRGLVALSGVVSIILVFATLRGTAGAAPALLSSALLAVSRPDVRSAHYVTPDVLVGTLALVMLAVWTRHPADRRTGILMGALVGAATAVKYNGLLLLPGAWAAAALRKDVRGIVLICIVAGVVFVLAAPYAVLGTGSGGRGVGALDYYYGTSPDSNALLTGKGSSMQEVYGLLVGGLGSAGCVLALLGFMSFRNARSEFGRSSSIAAACPREARAARPLGQRCPVVVPAAAILVAGWAAMIPANVVHPRHVVPLTPMVAVLAGAGFAWVLGIGATAGRRAAIGSLVALAALVPPARTSAALTLEYLQKPAVDRVAEWLEAAMEGRLVTTLPRFDLDPRRFEVTCIRDLDELRSEILAQYDFIVAPARGVEALREFRVVTSFASEDGDPDRRLLVLQAPPERAASTVAAPIPSAVRSSHEKGEPRSAWDGNAKTAWNAPPGSGSMEWTWERAVRVERIEVDVPEGPGFWPQSLRLLGTVDGRAWDALPADTLRPARPQRQRQGIPHGQAFALHGSPVMMGVRLERPDGNAWGIAEIRVYEARRSSSESR